MFKINIFILIIFLSSSLNAMDESLDDVQSLLGKLQSYKEKITNIDTVTTPFEVQEIDDFMLRLKNISNTQEKLYGENEKLKLQNERLTTEAQIASKRSDLLLKQNAKLQNDALYDRDVKFVFSKNFIYDWLPENLQSLRAESLSFVFIDIDRFKFINSTFGHTETDRIVELFAEQLNKKIEKKVRKNEGFLGRFGGDEFYLVLINTPMERVYELSEEIRSSIEVDKNLLEGFVRKSSSEVEKGQYYKGNTLTLSIGLSNITLTSEQVESAEQSRLAVTELVGKADQELYLGKLKGRNQVFYSGKCSLMFNK